MEDPKISKSDYQCIGCHFYDQLEAYATLKTKVSIAYKYQTEIKTIITKIIDLQTVNKQEFLITANKLKLRLDDVVTVIAL